MLQYPELYICIIYLISYICGYMPPRLYTQDKQCRSQVHIYNTYYTSFQLYVFPLWYTSYTSQISHITKMLSYI